MSFNFVPEGVAVVAVDVFNRSALLIHDLGHHPSMVDLNPGGIEKKQPLRLVETGWLVGESLLSRFLLVGFGIERYCSCFPTLRLKNGAIACNSALYGTSV